MERGLILGIGFRGTADRGGAQLKTRTPNPAHEGMKAPNYRASRHFLFVAPRPLFIHVASLAPSLLYLDPSFLEFVDSVFPLRFGHRSFSTANLKSSLPLFQFSAPLLEKKKP